MSATVADTYFPFDAGAGAAASEAEWRQIFAFVRPGVVAGVDDDCEGYADSTGLHFKIKAGQVFINGHVGTLAAAATLSDLSSVAGLTGGTKRIDRLVARADYVNNRVEFDVLTGTPGSSPTEPALTQNDSLWEIPIARTKELTSASATLAASDVIDERVFARPQTGAPPRYDTVSLASGANTASALPCTTDAFAADAADLTVAAVEGDLLEFVYHGPWTNNSTVFGFLDIYNKTSGRYWSSGTTTGETEGLRGLGANVTGGAVYAVPAGGVARYVVQADDISAGLFTCKPRIGANAANRGFSVGASGSAKFWLTNLGQ